MRKSRNYKKKSSSQVVTVKSVLAFIAMLAICASSAGLKIYYSDAADDMLNLAEQKRHDVSIRNLEYQNLTSRLRQYTSAEYLVEMTHKWNLDIRPASPGQVTVVGDASYAKRKDSSTKQVVYAYVD